MGYQPVLGRGAIGFCRFKMVSYAVFMNYRTVLKSHLFLGATQGCGSVTFMTDPDPAFDFNGSGFGSGSGSHLYKKINGTGGNYLDWQ